MSDSRVAMSIEEGVAVVRMTRADKRNALDKRMIEALIATAKQIRKDKTIRAVILTGDDVSFSAGLDFPYVAQNPSIIPKFFLKLPWRSDNRFQRVAHIWRVLPVPVMAVIHGHCYGGGLQIALGCDFRFATPDAQLSIMEIKWGLIPDMSGTIALSKLTRIDIAQELSMTGRVISGQEAADIGLVTKCDSDPMRCAQVLAQQICERSPNAIEVTKQLFQKTWHTGNRRALFWERCLQLRLLGRRNQRIAMSNGIKNQNEPFIPR